MHRYRIQFITNISQQRDIIFFFLLLGFCFGFIYRWGARKLFSGSVRGTKQNIQSSGRRLRAVAGVGLLLWALLTTLSPWLLFFAGFCFFEAIFSWCGFYAAIGKSSCPLE